MTHDKISASSAGTVPWRVVGRIVGWGAIAVLIVLPAIAMQYSNHVNWTASDFLFAAVLLGGAGVAVELTMRASRVWSYRLAMLGFVGGTFMTLWANGAVGIIGNEADDINMAFTLMTLAGVIAAILLRARSGAMIWIAALQGTGVLATGLVAELAFRPEWGPVLVFAAGWLVVALLFRAARAAVIK